MKIELGLGAKNNFESDKHFENYLNLLFRTNAGRKYESVQTRYNLVFTYFNNTIEYLDYGEDEMHRKLAKMQIRTLLRSQFTNVRIDLARCGYYVLCEADEGEQSICITKDVLEAIMERVQKLNAIDDGNPLFYVLLVDTQNALQLHVIYSKYVDELYDYDRKSDYV